MSALEPRLNAFRPDLADAGLRGKVEAPRFVEATRRRVVAFSAPLKRSPSVEASLDSEVLRGEVFRVFEETAEGWSWGQLETDSYVGYVPTGALGSLAPEPTHRVAALRTFVYPGPNLKLPFRDYLTLNAKVAVVETEGDYARLATGGCRAMSSSEAPTRLSPAAR